jgi:23S rRNA (guanosine2251-2'-O)-methyltransferase
MSPPARRRRDPKPVEIIPGFRAVREALLSDHVTFKELWIAKGKDSPRVQEILGFALEQQIPVQFKEKRELDELLPGVTHQGFAAWTRSSTYLDLDQLIDAARRSGEHTLLIAADHITDQGNLGAIIRTAVFFGVHGLILPRDRSAGLTDTVRKRSSGAYMHLPVAQVVNLDRALDRLSKEGFWIIGAAPEGPQSLYQFDWKQNLVLVLGSEDRGLSRLIRKRCDLLIRIPPQGQPTSLNVSVACGVILSEIIRQREESA